MFKGRLAVDIRIAGTSVAAPVTAAG